MLEELIKQLIAALDRNTTAHTGAAVESPKAEVEAPKTDKKTKSEKKADAPKEEAKVEVTLDQLREHGQKLLDAGKEATIREITDKFGQKRIRDLEPKDYAAALKLLEAESKKIEDSAL